MLERFCQRLKCDLTDLFPPEEHDPHEAPPRA
jgi:hypothetical protein